MIRTCILLQATPPHSGPEAFASDSRSNEGPYNDLDEAEPSSSSLIPMGGTRCEIYKDPHSVRSYVLHNLKYLHYSSEKCLMPNRANRRNLIRTPPVSSKGSIPVESRHIKRRRRDRARQAETEQISPNQHLGNEGKRFVLDTSYLYSYW